MSEDRSPAARRRSTIRRPAIHLAVIAAAGALVLAGCSHGGSKTAATTSTTAPATSSSSAPTASSTTGPAGSSTSSSTTAPVTSTTAPKACTSGPGTIPDGSVPKQVGDVDGDGKPDTAWLGAPSPTTGAITFGIVTAAGGGATISYQSASPIPRSALVVDADQRAPTEIIISDGRSASLYAFSGCAIVPMRNLQGHPYTFDLGDRIGTGSGIGCATTAAGRRLVGLNHTPPVNGTVHWTQTVIDLNGTEARNGAVTHGTYTAATDQGRINELDAITCGDLTMEHDGLQEPGD